MRSNNWRDRPCGHATHFKTWFQHANLEPVMQGELIVSIKYENRFQVIWHNSIP